MSFYYKKQWWKIILLIIAIVIGLGSLYYTNKLVNNLANEERKKIELWAEATRQLGLSDATDKDFSFLLDVIQNNTTVPVILADQKGNISSSRNFDSIKSLDTLYLKAQLAKMKKAKKRIKIEIDNNTFNYIYYQESYILKQLTYYPYIQLGVILLFILVAYLAFSASRNAEQNQVWVGLTKETAHQLGTPTSSLLAWKEILSEQLQGNEMVNELGKDINRLEIITDRFSKIGSKPTLKQANLADVITSAVDYLRSRTSNKVKFNFNFPDEDIILPISNSLFEWVIENLCKNAVDAINGEGSITITISKLRKRILIDIADTGKGIPKSKYKTVFKPGYTTKTRGWGLGLSLAKRIIENYHQGKIFVLSSEPNKGTTFRISLKA